LCHLVLFTKSPDQPSHRAEVRMFRPGSPVSLDIDHVYRPAR
jgi:hypothetical protein